MLNRRISVQCLGLLLAGLCMMPLSYATQVLEGDERTSSYGVQVIEGDEEADQKAPIPHHTHVAGAAASIRNSTRNLPGVIATYNRRLDPMSIHQMAEAIEIISNYYHIDARLLASLVAVESSFNPAAISSSGAIGLGQLKPTTAQWLGIPDPYDPVQNLVGAAKYLRFLLDRYNGSVHHALAAYFQGQGTIDKRGIDHNATYYISKIAKVYNRF